VTGESYKYTEATPPKSNVFGISSEVPLRLSPAIIALIVIILVVFCIVVVSIVAFLGRHKAREKRAAKYEHMP